MLNNPTVSLITFRGHPCCKRTTGRSSYAHTWTSHLRVYYYTPSSQSFSSSHVSPSARAWVKDGDSLAMECFCVCMQDWITGCRAGICAQTHTNTMRYLKFWQPFLHHSLVHRQHVPSSAVESPQPVRQRHCMNTHSVQWFYMQPTETACVHTCT